MRTILAFTTAFLLAGFASVADAQTPVYVLLNPNANQTINQTGGTSISVNGTLNATYLNTTFISFGTQNQTILNDNEDMSSVFSNSWNGNLIFDTTTNGSGGTISALLDGNRSAYLVATDSASHETMFCAASPNDTVGVGGPDACNAFDLFDVSNRETFGNGYMHWFLDGATSNAWNAGISNPSAGVLSFDTTTDGNGAGTINVGKLVFPDHSFITSAAALQSGGTNGQLTVTGPGVSTVTIESTTPANQGLGSVLLLRSNAREWAAVNWNSGNGGSLPGALGIVDNSAGVVRQLFDAAGNIFIGNNAPGGDFSGSSLSVLANGSVGVNTTTPGADLTSLPAPHTPPAPGTKIFEVNGDIALSYHSGGSMYFQDGTQQSTAWNGTTFGGDYAESVDVQGDRTTYEPGDVIIIDGQETGKFNKSDQAYSKLVAGVFSTKPGLVGRRTTYERLNEKAEVPMAMMGIAPTKVTTENGPIERGDLLVSSSTPGYAMKGTDPTRMMGAVIGKALAPLKAGSAVIEVLISLQ